LSRIRGSTYTVIGPLFPLSLNRANYVIGHPPLLVGFYHCTVRLEESDEINYGGETPYGATHESSGRIVLDAPGPFRLIPTIWKL
jgi:hypothetical protein